MNGNKLSQIQAWAEEFKTYSDVIKTPGWRMLENLILDQREWYSGEIDRVIKERTIPDRYGTMMEISQEQVLREVEKLQCHMEEDEIIIDLILGKIKQGYNACKAVERRLVQQGLLEVKKVTPPKFQEVK